MSVRAGPVQGTRWAVWVDDVVIGEGSPRTCCALAVELRANPENARRVRDLVLKETT